MKKKIIIILSIVSLLSLFGGILLIKSIDTTASQFNELIKFHKVEILRESLLLNIRRVEVDLYSQGTRYAESPDTIKSHIYAMKEAINTCFGCHHEESVLLRLNDLQYQVNKFGQEVSKGLTLKMGAGRLHAVGGEGHLIGDSLIRKIDTMIAITKKKLSERTDDALREVHRTRILLIMIIAAGPFVIALMAMPAVRGVTRPIQALLDATRKLKTGNLEYRIIGLRDEFGELAVGFNAMAGSLKEQVKKIEESEKRYRLLFESAGDAIFILDGEGDNMGKIVAANQAAAKMHGYTHDELLTMNIGDLDDPDAAGQMPEQMERMLKGEWIKREINHIRKDGTIFPVAISAGLLELGGHRYILAIDSDITERKQAEEALQLSQEKYRLIVDTANEGICLLDNDDKISFVNIQMGKMLKYEAEEMIGREISSFIFEEDLLDNAQKMEKRRLGIAEHYELRWRCKDGQVVQTIVSAIPLLDVERRYLGSFTMVLDITERKKAEDALKESEERFALAARGANDGLWDWNLRNRKVYFSSRWKSMLGFDENEINDDPEEWLSRVHPDDRKKLEAGITAHLNRQNPHFEGEYRIMHKDGTYRWVLSRGLAVRDDEGYAYRMAGSQTDITLRKKVEDQLIHDAFHDALTGLPNRALFLDRLQHLITTSRRRVDVNYAVLYLDMDRFKIVNDSLGHTIGDQLLIAVGRKLSECIRPGDTVARLGGDEFAILLENISELKDAVDVAERIHQKMSTSVMVKDHELFSSFSIGIALGSDHYERPEQVLRDSDIAMYLAKGRGTANYEIFDTNMHASILYRLQMESDLRGALEHREFIVLYQPIINLKTHRLTGFEALVRWNHPKRGLIYPMEFIQMAEESGHILAIGDWILQEACSNLKRLQEKYPAQPPLNMSVNISSKQFVQHDLVNKVAGIIRETRIDPHSLVLEITESMIMESLDTAVATMNGLREMGIQIHLDDFGTGYSSLSYLHSLPINALKIDRSFISKLKANGENQEVILSIISLANNLHLDVIAEGIEMEYQMDKVTALLCNLGQGYFFAYPMDQNGIDAWLKSNKFQI
jgi:diguanylate cyclase (GGDEF)-like protein/PAS domain S-box-containing protein